MPVSQVVTRDVIAIARQAKPLYLPGTRMHVVSPVPTDDLAKRLHAIGLTLEKVVGHVYTISLPTF